MTDKDRVLGVDCAIESRYDVVKNPPAPLPIAKGDQPDMFFGLMGRMVRGMLGTSADGIVYYEHCGNDERTWETLREAHGLADRG